MEYNLLHNESIDIVAKYNMELLQQKQQEIPNAIQYNIKRYRKPANWNYANTSQLVYHYNEKNVADNYVALRFCIVMQQYCKEKKYNCDNCKQLASFACAEKIHTVDFVNLKFTANHLQQFFSAKQTSTLFENIIQFKLKETFSTSVDLNEKSIQVLQNILNHSYTGSFENIYFNAQTQMLLLYTFDNLSGNNETAFTCKFLATETEREKILKARNILLQQIGEPLTIKALSRKVAMNECYLKKGFREMFGQTIFDFYQSQRMEHAKYLLYTDGKTVTDVAEMLGYSSISHFSTAFKKLTGIKPCELLLR
jgi:AraC family transcriptional regulator